MKISKNLVALCIGITLLSVFYYSYTSRIVDSDPQVAQANQDVKVNTLLSTNEKPSTTTKLAFNDLNSTVDRNIGKVEQFIVPNASGTVVLIPQQHQSPGTDADDPTNDLAELTQNQIYEIISELHSKLGLSFVMAEGDMFGSVPEKKISYLASLISYRDQLSNYLNALSTSTQNIAQTKILSADLGSYIRSINREISLSGAPYKLKAEGTPLTIYGIENPQTMDESANAVRDYVYLQDRLAELSSKNAKQSGADITSLERAYLAMFPPKTEIQKISYDISTLDKTSLTSNNQALLTNVGDSLKAIVNLKQSTISTSTLPSRSQNPYSKIKDAKTINSLLKKADDKIGSIIIDKRNSETATNIQTIMSNEHLPSLILQFGAGHEAGIVKDLNAEGLSVVVVTPAALVNTSLHQN